MTSLGLLIVGGMLGFIFGYATAILLTQVKRQEEESEDDGRREDI